MQTTALVHEAYLRLIDVDRVDWQHRAHFFAVAAQMRRIWLDLARKRGAAKRGELPCVSIWMSFPIFARIAPGGRGVPSVEDLRRPRQKDDQS